MAAGTKTLHRGVTLVLGGARSGKSLFAEQLVLGSGLKPVFLATGRAIDEEMSERIAIHCERRGKAWETIEEPLALADALDHCALAGRAVLVDCLTLWMSNLMEAEADPRRECQSLIAALDGLKAPVVLVSNEVGLGTVPENAIAREFRDLAGEVHQHVARAANEVWFVAAGLPLKIKGES